MYFFLGDVIYCLVALKTFRPSFNLLGIGLFTAYLLVKGIASLVLFVASVNIEPTPIFFAKYGYRVSGIGGPQSSVVPVVHVQDFPKIPIPIQI